MKRVCKESGKIVVSSYHTLVFYFKDGNVTTQEWKSTALKDMWTDEQKKSSGNGWRCIIRMIRPAVIPLFGTHCMSCVPDKFIRCLEKRKNRQVAYWRCRGENRCIHVRSIKEEWLQRMAAETMGKLEFDDAAFRTQVQRIKVQDNETLLFYLAMVIRRR